MTIKTHDIYVASPLFAPEDHAGLDVVENLLDELGITYFSPRKDSQLDLRGAKTPEEKAEVAQKIFEMNEQGIKNAKLILVNTIGTRWNNAIYGDAGTMVEAGMAFALNIPVITYNFKGYGLNIMLSQKAVYHCDSLTLDNDSQLRNILKEVITRIRESDGSPDPQVLRNIFWETKDRELV